MVYNLDVDGDVFAGDQHPRLEDLCYQIVLVALRDVWGCCLARGAKQRMGEKLGYHLLLSMRQPFSRQDSSNKNNKPVSKKNKSQRKLGSVPLYTKPPLTMTFFPLSLPPCYFCRLTLYFSLISFLFPKNMANYIYRNTECEPFSCHNYFKYNLTIPYRHNNQRDYCGHPSLKLNCEFDMVTININSRKFRVLDVNQDSGILTIVAIDILKLHNGIFPKTFTDVTLGSTFFIYTQKDAQYTLLFDCSPLPDYSPLNKIPYIPFSCAQDGVQHHGRLVSTTNAAHFNNLGCKNSITLPLLEDSFNKSVPN
ncbi:LEAF RUST 10 DISEASE-RESISTANCE LOCUS RECEPTOR-LIKE PROTEIN KINASE-like 2.7 isoform X1 [Lotus japonicus]|uniref:LEAF RUST 10 DISEASE-RESISTANCE LOCUS RECEPTOR-LIKE PROTEIN KINASE-like 2.7 isoform X1 n=1 Tax=Lotus japonicus TaxID=34305 RepID=UPI002590D413|nr:LEAF RUST 10 DISEASE-RESISTANCE LOCUS RECEPTOR-LIKE PROTEIN KINASE-like 2.7 isoform X1 [Lotus japonicus]